METVPVKFYVFNALKKALKSQRRNKPAWTLTVGPEVFPPQNRREVLLRIIKTCTTM